MKKRIFTFLTLLVAFFGLIGLTTNNYKVINAAENTTSVDSDLASINVPDTAIISFPVTYESVHGNKIEWTVQADQTIIEYDEEAHWMVVNRPETGEDQTVTITVTVGEGENAKNKEFTVKVPSGKTAAPIYTITYTDGEEVVKEETYKLGEKTKVLEKLQDKEGYKFDGWYENNQKVEKIYVGSNKNYNLEARWTRTSIPLTEVTGELEKTEIDYNTESYKPVANLKHGENTLLEGKDYVLSYTKAGQSVEEIKDAGEYKVIVTPAENSIYTGSMEFTFTVKQKQVTLTANSVEYTYGDTPVTDGYKVTSGTLTDAEKTLLNPQLKIEGDKVVVTYTENDNYVINVVDGQVTMNKRDITVKANDLTSVYDSALLELTFSVTDYEITASDLAELKELLTLTKAEGTSNII